MAVLKLKVSPKASRNALLGWHDDALKVAVTAAPDKGKANAAVVKMLARLLQLPKADIRITHGLTSPHKTLTVSGLDTAQLQQRIAQLLE